MKTFWIQHGYSGREALKVMDIAPKMGHKVNWGKNPPQDIIPIGDVEFCESFLVRPPMPDFAPLWLRHFWHRKIYLGMMARLEENERFASEDSFVKSASKYKAFPAKIVKAGELWPHGLLVISEVVKFDQEWRYYVADGQVLATGWYDGTNEDEPAPELNIEWPADFCGAVDFGRLTTGEIALVESQHPYACGWYGDDHVSYINWLIKGWDYMLRHPRI